MENGTFDDETLNLERRVGSPCAHPKPSRVYLQPSFEEGERPLVMGTCSSCRSDYHIGAAKARADYNVMYRHALVEYARLMGKENK